MTTSRFRDRLVHHLLDGHPLNDPAAPERAKEFVAGATPVIAAGVAASFFISPFLTFLPLGKVEVAGLLVVAGVYVTAATSIRDSGWRRAAIRTVGVSLIGVGLLLMTDALADAAHRVRTRNRQCLALQRDMFSRRPVRPDSSSLFSAIGCSYQGDVGTSSPPPANSSPAGRARTAPRPTPTPRMPTFDELPLPQGL